MRCHVPARLRDAQPARGPCPHNGALLHALQVCRERARCGCRAMRYDRELWRELEGARHGRRRRADGRSRRCGRARVVAYGVPCGGVSRGRSVARGSARDCEPAGDAVRPARGSAAFLHDGRGHARRHRRFGAGASALAPDADS
eukprot:Amastigsp_a508535_595.p5 type:complete len:144 gc:universal Amastigsp_a508535_595:1035-604(-)